MASPNTSHQISSNTRLICSIAHSYLRQNSSPRWWCDGSALSEAVCEHIHTSNLFIFTPVQIVWWSRSGDFVPCHKSNLHVFISPPITYMSTSHFTIKWLNREIIIIRKWEWSHDIGKVKSRFTISMPAVHGDIRICLIFSALTLFRLFRNPNFYCIMSCLK